MKTTRYLTDREAAQIVKMRREGLTMALISQRSGRSMHAVRRALRAAQIPAYRVTAPSARRTWRCNRIVKLAQQGMCPEDVAAALNITPNVLKNTVTRNMLKDPLLMGGEELAALVGVSYPALMRALDAGRVAHSWWFTRRVFTPDQVQAAQQHYAHHLTADDTAHWLTAAQVARELGLTPDALFYRIRKQGLAALGLRRVRVSGVSGRVFRYDPRVVMAIAQQQRAA